MIASEVPTATCMLTILETERTQHLVEDRHQHSAAADAEQAGEKTRDGAGRHQRQHERQKFGK